MLSLISKALGMSKTPEYVLGGKHYVDLSGNTFSFAIPEGFSKDMPAKNVLRRIDVNDLTSSKMIVQRWWDVKEDKVFSKELGTVMMTVYVSPVPSNTQKKLHDVPYEIDSRLDFVQAIIENLSNQYRQKNSELSDLYSIPGLAYLFGDEISGEMRDIVINNQKWTGYSVTGPNEQLIVALSIPIESSAYLNVDYSFAPNDNVQPRYFRDQAYKITNLIDQTLFVEYKDQNTMENVVEKKWLHQDFDEVLRENQALIEPKIFERKALENFSKAK